MKQAGKRYVVAVDFDGVIHSYTSPWVSAEVIPDAPVEGAIEWLCRMVQKFTVVIFTTRGKTEEGRKAVLEWIQRHHDDRYAAVTEGDRKWLVSNLTVTAEKPPALIYLDDRAYRFEGPGTFPTSEQIHAAKPWNKR